MGTPGWVYQRNEAIRTMSHLSERQELQERIKQLEVENGKLRESTRPVCRCQSCGSTFAVKPIPDQDSVESYGQRLLKVICFKCGSDAGHLTIVG